jgi:3-methyladenine DNA glycosylase Tag
MRSFDEIFSLAAERKGGKAALEAMLSKPKSAAELSALGDDRWLAAMTKSVFQAGFNWKVIENKWPGFEEVFEGFDPRRWAMMSDEDLDRLVKDARIVRNAAKILSVRDNAIFLSDLAREHASAGGYLANWPSEDYIGLLDLMKRRGGRLGGTTAQYFLRQFGKDSFILSKDVTAALIREGVVEKAPGSRSSMRAVQDAFNSWTKESGRSLTEVSRVLAMSVGA